MLSSFVEVLAPWQSVLYPGVAVAQCLVWANCGSEWVAGVFRSCRFGWFIFRFRGFGFAMGCSTRLSIILSTISALVESPFQLRILRDELLPS